MQLNFDHMGGVMENKHNIRIMSVIDAADQDNTSLVDALVCNAGLISAKIARNVNGRQDRYNTSMYFEYKVDAGEVAKKDGDEAKAENDGFNRVRVSKDSFLINLIDFPNRSDHPTDATATLRVTDGALFVVDCVDGVIAQLRAAMSERVRPCLMFNNVDRALLERQLSAEEIYQNMSRAIENANIIIESCKFQDRDWQVVPCRGNVAFGSSLHQWGFTLQTFAKVYASKFSIPEKKMAEKLWGEWVFATNDGKNRWINSNSVNTNRGVDRYSGAKRAFVAFIMDPIISMFQAVMNNEQDEKGVAKVFVMAQAVGVSLSEDIINTTTKDALLTFIMQKWLPVAEAVREMIVVHLPSPATAQEYRCEALYDGPLGDEAATAIRACDNSEGAPLVMYVSKMTTVADNRFIAFGRVFSGKILNGQEVRVLGPEYMPGKKTDLLEMTVHLVAPTMGGSVTSVPAGNVCGVIALEKYIPQFTITGSEAVCGMKVPAVAGLVRATVSVADAAESHRLSEAIRALDRSDPVVRLETTDAGEHVIAAPSDLHLAMYLSALQRSVKGILIATPVLALAKGGASSSAPHAILSETAMPALNAPETGRADAAAETMEQRLARAAAARETVADCMHMIHSVKPEPVTLRGTERDLEPVLRLSDGDHQSEQEFRRICAERGYEAHAGALLTAVRSVPADVQPVQLLFSVHPLKSGKLQDVLTIIAAYKGALMREGPEREGRFTCMFNSMTRLSTVLLYLFTNAEDLAQSVSDIMFIAVARERGDDVHTGLPVDHGAHWDIYEANPFLYDTAVGPGVEGVRVFE